MAASRRSTRASTMKIALLTRFRTEFMVERKVCLSSNDVAVGSFTTEPSRAKIQHCPLCSKSDHSRQESELTLCAISGLMHSSKQHLHSITSSPSAVEWPIKPPATGPRASNTRHSLDDSAPSRCAINLGHRACGPRQRLPPLSLIHISEPTRLGMI